MKITKQLNDKEFQSIVAIGTILPIMGYETTIDGNFEIRINTGDGMVRVIMGHDEAEKMFAWSRKVFPYKDIKESK